MYAMQRNGLGTPIILKGAIGTLYHQEVTMNYVVFANTTIKCRVPPEMSMPAWTREPGWRRNSPKSNLTTSFASGK